MQRLKVLEKILPKMPPPKNPQRKLLKDLIVLLLQTAAVALLQKNLNLNKGKKKKNLRNPPKKRNLLQKEVRKSLLRRNPRGKRRRQRLLNRRREIKRFKGKGRKRMQKQKEGLRKSHHHLLLEAAIVIVTAALLQVHLLLMRKSLRRNQLIQNLNSQKKLKRILAKITKR